MKHSKEGLFEFLFDQLFCTPWYEGLFVDQSLVMNRRADGDRDKSSNSVDEEDDEDMKFNPNWHENESSKSSVKEEDNVIRWGNLRF